MLSGDGTLRASPRTLEIARAAVEESDRNVQEAARTPGDLPYEELKSRVWAYTPRPTRNGDALISRFIERYANPAIPETIEAFSRITIENLAVGIQELQAEGYMRPKPRRSSPGTRLPDGTYVPGRMPGGAYIDERGNVSVPTG